MPDPKPTDPAPAAASHEVTLPMDLSLPENVNASLPPLIIRIALPEEFFADGVRQK